MANDSLRQLSDTLNMATAQLSGDPQRMQMALGMQQSRKLQQQDQQWNEWIDVNVKDQGKAKLLRLMGREAGIKSILGSEDKDRKIVEGIDGFKYYADTQERVLPNIKEPNTLEIKTSDIIGAQKDERKTFEAANKGVKNFQQLLDAAESADGAASYALMIKFIKQLDDSVVREGEVATFGGFQGALENFRLYVNKAEGKGFTPIVKANMINLASQTANRLVEDYNTYRAGKQNSYEVIGFDPEMIFSGLDFNLKDLDLTKKYTPEDFEEITGVLE